MGFTVRVSALASGPVRRERHLPRAVDPRAVPARRRLGAAPGPSAADCYLGPHGAGRTAAEPCAPRRDRAGRRAPRLRLRVRPRARPSPTSPAPATRNRGRRLREMLDELGPTFVKFGQLLSTRPDIVPPDILAELRGLQDDARPEPFSSDARGGRGGARPHDRAGLRGVRRGADRRGVDRPGAPRAPARRAGGGGQGPAAGRRAPDQRRHPAALPGGPRRPGAGAPPPVHRPGRARSTSSRAPCAASSTTASRPATPRSSGATSRATRPCRCRSIYWRYTTSRVLTMERVEGTPLSQLDLSTWSSDERRRLGNRLTETWMQMVFVHGFFHADPHPANILVRGADQHQPGRLRHDRAAHAARPRGGRAAAARHPQPATPSACRGACGPSGSAIRARRRSELADRLGVILQRYSATRHRRDRRARGAARDLPDDLPPRHHAAGALGDARQDARDAGRASPSRSTPTSTCSRSRAPTRCGWRPQRFRPGPHREPHRAPTSGATPRPSSSTRSRSPSCSTSSRTARSRSRSVRRASRRPWTSSRRARTASCWASSPPRSSSARRSSPCSPTRRPRRPLAGRDPRLDRRLRPRRLALRGHLPIGPLVSWRASRVAFADVAALQEALERARSRSPGCWCAAAWATRPPRASSCPRTARSRRPRTCPASPRPPTAWRAPCARASGSRSTATTTATASARRRSW